MHVGFRVELSHPRVDPRHAGAPFAPFLPPLGIIFPLDEVEFEVLREVHGSVGRGYEGLPVEFPEDDLAYPGVDPAVPRVEVFAAVVFLGAGEHVADRDDPRGEVGG